MSDVHHSLDCELSHNLQLCDTITYFQSVGLDGGELPLSSTERDQSVIQSLRMHTERKIIITTH